MLTLRMISFINLLGFFICRQLFLQNVNVIHLEPKVGSMRNNFSAVNDTKGRSYENDRKLALVSMITCSLQRLA